MIHLVGDVQGCAGALDALLAEIGFSPSRDTLYVLGDLVNRGPDSAAVIERLSGFGAAAVCLLGNHDLHLLALAQGARKRGQGDTLDALLESPQRAEWIDWLRHQHMAVQAHGWLMVHAGVVPQWDVALTLALASEVESRLRDTQFASFLQVMYGNEPSRWSGDLQGDARLRFAVNVLTRIRFVAADGTLDLETKEGASAAPAGLHPWFDAPRRRTAGVPIACGHWSTLGLVVRDDLLAIDTGCVWGGSLTAVRIDGGRREVTQLKCAQAQSPQRKRGRVV